MDNYGLGSFMETAQGHVMSHNGWGTKEHPTAFPEGSAAYPEGSTASPEGPAAFPEGVL